MSDKEKVEAVLELMSRVQNELEDRQDVEDGRDGSPRPNFAMRICMEIEEMEKRVLRQDFPRPQVSFPNGVEQ